MSLQRINDLEIPGSQDLYRIAVRYGNQLLKVNLELLVLAQIVLIVLNLALLEHLLVQDLVHVGCREPLEFGGGGDVHIQHLVYHHFN